MQNSRNCRGHLSLAVWLPQALTVDMDDVSRACKRANTPAIGQGLRDNNTKGDCRSGKSFGVPMLRVSPYCVDQYPQRSIMRLVA
jgi:hypothetical protein